MSDAVSGYGTLLKMGDGAEPEVYTTVAEVKDIGGPEMEADVIEVTNQDSTGGWKEFIAGLLDAGEVTFDVNWLPGDATQDATTGLVSVMFARVKRNFRLQWPGTGAGKVCTFPALVTGISPDSPVDDANTASITLKVTGPPVFSAAA